MDRYIRWFVVLALCWLTLLGHRWPIVVFMIVNQMSHEIVAETLEEIFAVMRPDHEEES